MWSRMNVAVLATLAFTYEPRAVPEPATALLVGLGLVALASRGSRGRR
jgi:hypothetical protein